MRITYRYKKNKDYWKGRWENIPVDKPMTNKNVYPLKYSEICINNSREGKILEAGCGNGRILRYYHNQGYKISGFSKSSNGLLLCLCSYLHKYLKILPCR